jgi:hypothetical protein
MLLDLFWVFKNKKVIRGGGNATDLKEKIPHIGKTNSHLQGDCQRFLQIC